MSLSKASLAKTQRCRARQEKHWDFFADFASWRLGERLPFAFFLLTSIATAGEKAIDADHLLYLADDGLAVIRITIDIDGESQRDLCRKCLAAICTTADRDSDGLITGDEYDAHIGNHPVFQERLVRASPGMNATLPRPEFIDGKLSLDQTVDFLVRRVWSPVLLEFASNQMQQISPTGQLLDRPIGDSQLFARLDTDGNRKLTGRELDKAAEVLAKLDFDEDETLSLDELRMQSPAVGTPVAINRAPRQTDSHLSLLPRGRIDAQFVHRILTRYDGEAKDSYQDLRLDRNEVGVGEAIFAQADADMDGYWDFDELRRFLERPQPSVDIVVHLVTGNFATAKATAEATVHNDTAAKTFDQRASSLGLDVHGTQLRLLLPTSESLVLDDAVRVQFQTLDGDKNEYLEPSEFPFGSEGDGVSPIFKQMDTDDNGKVSLAEFERYHIRGQQARASQIVIHAENLKRTLFGPLDANADGRLSQRELATLAARIAEWDADGDGALREEEIPQQYRLTLSRGEDRLSSFASQLYVADGVASPTAPTSGPLWFRKMDRNRDGEVSAREFLGPATRFEKIDANADGAIDADEAAAVK